MGNDTSKRGANLIFNFNIKHDMSLEVLQFWLMKNWRINLVSIYYTQKFGIVIGIRMIYLK